MKGTVPQRSWSSNLYDRRDAPDTLDIFEFINACYDNETHRYVECSI